METERLQEIKEYSQFVDECDYPEGADVIEMHRYMKELITALTEVQAELVKLKKHIEKGEDVVLELRAELAEANIAMGNLINECDKQKADLRT